MLLVFLWYSFIGFLWEANYGKIPFSSVILVDIYS